MISANPSVFPARKLNRMRGHAAPQLDRRVPFHLIINGKLCALGASFPTIRLNCAIRDFICPIILPDRCLE